MPNIVKHSAEWPAPGPGVLVEVMVLFIMLKTSSTYGTILKYIFQVRNSDIKLFVI